MYIAKKMEENEDVHWNRRYALFKPMSRALHSLHSWLDQQPLTTNSVHMPGSQNADAGSKHNFIITITVVTKHVCRVTLRSLIVPHYLVVTSFALKRMEIAKAASSR